MIALMSIAQLAVGRGWRPAIRRLLWAVLFAAPVLALGQDPAVERRAFAAAERAFSDGVYERAEREFAQFVLQYPQSSRLPAAILYQAQAALKLNKLVPGLFLLTNNVGRAGALADQYRYWQAEAHLQQTNYLAAAETFALLAKEFTNSVRLLEAGYGEALARFRLGDLEKVVSLLQQSGGTFQKAARIRANDKITIRGHLLLAEALIEEKRFQAAEEVMLRLPEEGLTHEYRWQRQYLICRARMAAQRFTEALEGATNLLALAAAGTQRNLIAESLAVEGEVREHLRDFDNAILAYEKNLPDTVPAEYARQAFVKIIELCLAQNRVVEALDRLGAFLVRHPGDVASDLVLLTLGEVHLKLHVGGADTNQVRAFTNGLPALTNRLAGGTNVLLTATNHLQAAMVQFDRLIGSFTNSPFLGKAQLDRGWCLWLDGRIAESSAAFQVAAELLPLGEGQAVARFKLADAQYFLKDYTNAQRNYRALVDKYQALPRVRDTLLDHALYQLVRVSLELDDLGNATEAMRRLLQGQPSSAFNDRSMLLVGQSLAVANRPAEARAVFMDLARRIPGSPLLPEVELAIARTYVQERNWEAAVACYNELADRLEAHPLQPAVEFNRAWSYYQAGRETNALLLFTNFVAQFPSNALAAEAQFWVGTYYFNQKDFVSAEKSFQDKVLMQSTNFSHQARMMAVRAAFARQSWKDAYDYLTNVVNDSSCPTNLLAEAFFALGDTFIRQETTPAESLKRFDDALKTFKKITLNTPTSPLVPAAWGRMGDCYFQLAAQDETQYANATNAYATALILPGAEVAVRFQAEVKLARTMEKMAQQKSASDATNLLKAAFEHYYNIVSDKALTEGESADPFWYKEAGLAAARLAEELKQWDVAVRIYDRVLSVLPHLRPVLEKKLEKAREQVKA